jgi:hypothetical protein
MGIHANIVPLLSDIGKRAQFSGTICTLGVQHLPAGTDQASLFSKLGFSQVETLDVSDYEGAEHVFDLNADDLPRHLVQKYDAVLNGGTLEHVFHVPNALTSITRMLRTGGHVIHIVPCSGWVDHGFYQISPTLMLDYYAAAGFDAFESVLCSFDLDDASTWRIRPISPGDLGTGHAGVLSTGVHLYVFAARKGTSAIERPIPMQRLYATSPQFVRPRWFRPYDLVNGVVRDISLRAETTLEKVAHETGHCWTASLSGLSDAADDSMHPVRSLLILLEDGNPIGPSHASHQVIRDDGRGAFSHWTDAIYFSTSDNSDPTKNGRVYSIIVPR